MADLEHQYELAMMLDCDIACVRLIRIAGLDEADIEWRAHRLVVVPEGVREAYRPAYRRGVAIAALAVETGAGDQIEAEREEVLRLLDLMKRVGL
jgi:hypothetical protein